MHNPAVPWRAGAALPHARPGDRVAADRLHTAYALTAAAP